jgi:hypothetical protein
LLLERGAATSFGQRNQKFARAGARGFLARYPTKGLQNEKRLIAAARSGDDAAFDTLLAKFRTDPDGSGEAMPNPCLA